jgi:hypothetical protein
VILYPYSAFTIESSTPTLRINLNERTIVACILERISKPFKIMGTQKSIHVVPKIGRKSGNASKEKICRHWNSVAVSAKVAFCSQNLLPATLV